VLRLREGDELVLFDGRGRQWLGRIARATRDEVLVDVVDPLPALPEPPVAVTLAVALLKGDQMSGVVRDAVALGVSAIVPFVSQHVALPAPAWRTRAVERWTRIAVSSAAQCGRAVVPTVSQVVRFGELLAGPAFDARLMCVEPAHAAAAGPGRPMTPPPGSALLLVGPEGGWSDDEIGDARAAAVEWVHLGPRTLRAEVAPTVALSVLWATWGW